MPEPEHRASFLQKQKAFVVRRRRLGTHANSPGSIKQKQDPNGKQDWLPQQNAIDRQPYDQKEAQQVRRYNSATHRNPWGFEQHRQAKLQLVEKEESKSYEYDGLKCCHSRSADQGQPVNAGRQPERDQGDLRAAEQAGVGRATFS